MENPRISVKNEKAILRLKLRDKRNTIPSRRHLEAEQQAYQFLSETVSSHSLVLSYASFGTELNLWQLNHSLSIKGKLALPRMQGSELQIFRVDSIDTQLTANKWGILEPIPQRCQEIDFESILLVLVPGLGFNPDNNHRIGYGKGFYDRLLPKLNLQALKYGIGFKEQSCQDIPIEKNDFPLSHIHFF